MRKFLSSVILTALTISASAQESALAEITSNRLLCASNYVAYQAPSQKLTPAPKGYEPFYISTYARHGSRWLINDSQYSGLIEKLSAAKKYGKLTPKGEEVLDILKEFYKTTEKRLGDLTPVGERQHHGIGKRMTQNFPEVFRGNAQVDARSTVVIRCMLSMVAECEELTAFNPQLRIHNDVSEAFQYYLNKEPHDQWIRDANREKRRRVSFDYKNEYTHPERFCRQIVTDDAYVRYAMNAGSFMRRVFDICSNMQSHDNAPDLYDLFTEEECYDQWRIRNIDWYLDYSSGQAPHTQDNLLRNFLETADTIVGQKDFHGATLRFGHEVCVMPLAALMELGDCYPEVDLARIDTLDRVWANYRIFPMASNIQLVFYRPKKGREGDILVKAMLNEHEQRLPLPTDQYPYYRWQDVRAFFEKKLK
jgi:hypothetical protein